MSGDIGGTGENGPPKKFEVPQYLGK